MALEGIRISLVSLLVCAGWQALQLTWVWRAWSKRARGNQMSGTWSGVMRGAEPVGPAVMVWQRLQESWPAGGAGSPKKTWRSSASPEG